MSAAWTKADVRRACQAIEAVGLSIEAVEIWPDGRLRVLTKAPGGAVKSSPITANDDPEAALDRFLEDQGHASGRA